MKNKIGWVCSTSFFHELVDDNAHGIEIYGSRESLIDNEHCCSADDRHCAPVKVEVKVLEEEKRPKNSKN
jgi:hypothetical protein